MQREKEMKSESSVKIYMGVEWESLIYTSVALKKQRIHSTWSILKEGGCKCLRTDWERLRWQSR